MRTWLIFIAACSSTSTQLPQGPPPSDAHPVYECNCNPVFQFGCSVGEKCTWLFDPDGSQFGFVGCTASGSAAIGEPCSFATPYTDPECGSRIGDNCVRGAVCSDGICKAVCDNQGGQPMCDDAHACEVDPALFSTGMTSPHAAGVCDLACDPLVDNDFLGSGVRGSGCGAGSGCYGEPSEGTPPKTQFACMAEGSGVDRDAAPSAEPNACAEGYEPIVHAATGSTTIVCVALCVPGDTYLGGPQAAIGVAPHRCAASDARGTFGAREHCMYLWRLEQDGSGNWLQSARSNTLGVCIDHAQYRYDSNRDGAIDGSDATWPDCQTLPLSGSDVVAADFGCVSTTTAPALPATPAPGL